VVPKTLPCAIVKRDSRIAMFRPALTVTCGTPPGPGNEGKRRTPMLTDLTPNVAGNRRADEPLAKLKA